MRLGGPVFLDTQDPAALAGECRRLGYRAAYCPDFVSLHDQAGMQASRQAFEAYDVAIAEVGAWCNPLDPRPEVAEKNIQYITERLALADEVGARCCVNIVGSRSTENWYAPHADNYTQETFDLTVELARRIVDTVKPRRTRYTFEVMPFNFLDSAQAYLDLIRAIDREAVGVHLDPVNCIHSPRLYFNNAQVIQESFRLLGPWIASCHAKDLRLNPEPYNTRLDEVRPGLGALDYRAFLREAAALPQDVPIMLEHLATQQEYAASAAYIRGVAQELGLAL